MAGDNEQLVGGWRKEVYKKGKQVLALVDKSRISLRKLKRSLKLEEVCGGRKLVSLIDKGDKWQIEWQYISGEVRWQWGEEESFKVGKKLKEFHQRNLAHLDIKPANVIWQGDEIKAVIDFEEARVGKRFFLKDAANTLSWILVSGGDKDSFLQGFGEVNDKMEEDLERYLKKRMTENNPGAFLMLAKERLEKFKKEIDSKLIRIDDLAALREKFKGKKIVLAVGAFELLHWGHLLFLKKAAKYGEILVVGVGSDNSRKRLHGPAHPLIGERTRAEILCYFEMVNKVVVVEEDDIRLVLQQLKPDILVVAKKDLEEKVRKAEELRILEEYGGKLQILEHLGPRVSSSQMIRRVAMQKIKHELFGGSRRSPILKMQRRMDSKKMVEVGDLEKLGKKLRELGKSVVFASLSADLFHVGHARFIQKAKSLGDVLVVGVPSNKSVAQLKGPGRPIVDETARGMVLSELPYVDYLVIFDERTILECLKRLKPEVFFTVKEDWNTGLSQSPEAKLMKSIAGKIVRSERMAPYISASKMIDKAAGEMLKKAFAGVLKTSDENPVINADFDPFSSQSQLAARERGFYSQVLKEVEKSGECVFCDLKEKYLISEKNGVVLTVALYPYIDGHLLIIPRRHVESIKDLNNQEWEMVKELVKKGEELLKKNLGVKNYWVLIREGDGIAAGKTVRHLHFHLMPYDMNVIRMGETKLNILPIDLAKKLRSG